MTRILAAVVVLAVGCAVWFGIETASLSPSDNAALVDAAATSSVTAEVGDAVKAVFSYDYANLARTERAAASLLTGDAVGQYSAQFTSARQHASAEKLVRTTTVRAIGVRTLRGDDASLLLFVDQQTIGPTGGAPQSSVAQLSVTARRIDGHWKLSSLTAL
jgi:Mce-associated membrane protein